MQVPIGTDTRWHVARVEVTHMPSGKATTFKYNDWMDAGSSPSVSIPKELKVRGG